MLLSLLLWSVPLVAQHGAGEDAAIRSIVAAQANAWNASDGAAYAQHVSPDVLIEAYQNVDVKPAPKGQP